jgi:hypothetical protein
VKTFGKLAYSLSYEYGGLGKWDIHTLAIAAYSPMREGMNLDWAIIDIDNIYGNMQEVPFDGYFDEPWWEEY